MEYLYLFGGLAALIVSGKYLVKGGIEFARHFKISTLVVGVTVVAFGTSAPELIVSAMSAWAGHPEIAIGNVIGSNISNIALVLALTAIILPIPVQRNSVRYDWPVMMLSFVLFYIFILNDLLERWEALIFIIGLIVYQVWTIRKSRLESKAGKGDKIEKAQLSLGISLLIILLSSAGLAVGAQFLVDGASQIARNFNVSERIISITIIAFGTSVPELTASIIAATRKQTDISIGNIIGSNIFNMLAVLGIAGVITPISADHRAFGFDILWMMIFSVLLFLFIYPFQSVYLKRWEGSILFVGYVLYIYLLLTFT